MNHPTVFYYPITSSDAKEISSAARLVLEEFLKDQKDFVFSDKPVLKIHPGQPGNVTYLLPSYYDGIIDFLLEQKKHPSFIETNVATGERAKKDTHIQATLKHGFIRIPYMIADGQEGEEYVSVPIAQGKHFTSCMIAKGLSEQKQVIVLSHFKGHIASGFGGTIKMLGIGFASRLGKIQQHSKVYTPEQKTINWGDRENIYWKEPFVERVVEYARAAVENKKNIYFNFALNLTKNCDCDGHKMKPLYQNLGILCSADPVAIDKTALDLLEKREGKKPFEDYGIFPYAEKLGLGSASYTLQTIPNEKK